MLVFHFFERKNIGFGKSDFVKFCFARAKRACALPVMNSTGGWIARHPLSPRWLRRTGARLPTLLRRGKYNKTQQLPFSRHEQGASLRNAAERGLRKIDCNRRVRSTSGEAALPPPQGDFLEKSRRRLYFSQKMRQYLSDHIPIHDPTVPPMISRMTASGTPAEASLVS